MHSYSFGQADNFDNAEEVFNADDGWLLERTDGDNNNNNNDDDDEDDDEKSGEQEPGVLRPGGCEKGS